LTGTETMYDVAIVSSVYGQYDRLRPVFDQTGLSVEWVLVTDKAPSDSLGWRVVIEERPGVHPNRAAKKAKFLPWTYTEAYASIWIDGSFQVISPNFAREAIGYAKPIAQFKHPWRDCLYQEAICTVAINRYAPQQALIEEQSKFYRENGHPEHWGLWATGVIARYHTPSVRALGYSWMSDVNEWSFQDQVSQPYSLRQARLYPECFPGDYFSSPWIRYMGHKHESG
jgi:alkaline ceramidase TOD1/glycosyltransferase MUCI70-like protein